MQKIRLRFRTRASPGRKLPRIETKEGWTFVRETPPMSLPKSGGAKDVDAQRHIFIEKTGLAEQTQTTLSDPVAPPTEEKHAGARKQMSEEGKEDTKRERKAQWRNKVALGRAKEKKVPWVTHGGTILAARTERRSNHASFNSNFQKRYHCRNGVGCKRLETRLERSNTATPGGKRVKTPLSIWVEAGGAKRC